MAALAAPLIAIVVMLWLYPKHMQERDTGDASGSDFRLFVVGVFWAVGMIFMTSHPFMWALMCNLIGMLIGFGLPYIGYLLLRERRQRQQR